jgi:hypothetical protein
MFPKDKCMGSGENACMKRIPAVIAALLITAVHLPAGINAVAAESACPQPPLLLKASVSVSHAGAAGTGQNPAKTAAASGRQIQIQSTAALLAKYRQFKPGGNQSSSMSNAQKQAAALAAGRAEQLRLQQQYASNRSNANALAAAIRSRSEAEVRMTARKLPRWGDKDCLCHEGLRLYNQHRYIEAAAYYHRAGQNMRQAWGRDTIDVANALRGEAACYQAAGWPCQADKLLARADAIVRAAQKMPAETMASAARHHI